MDRQVLRGSLGCPNCRDRFPVEEGFADLRPPPRGKLDDSAAGEGPDPEGVQRLAALLGLTEGPGPVALVGPVAAHAPGLAEAVEGLEVAAVAAELRRFPECPRVSRMACGPTLPFHSGALRGVVFGGPGTEGLLEEAARVVAPGGRVVATEPPPGVRRRLEAAGLRVLLEDPLAVAAERPGPRAAAAGGRRLPVV